MPQSIAFSEATADVLIQTAQDADQRLRNQGGERSSAADTALTDFAGGYARAFTEACAVEAQDRAGLASQLALLAETVRHAKQQAAAEQQRLDDVAVWQQSRDTGDLYTHFGLVNVMPPRPVAQPIVPLLLTVGFSAQPRVRTTFGDAEGAVSSASPTNLRSFADIAKTCNRIMVDEFSDLQDALAAYRTACSWAPLNVNVVSGFQDLIDENHADVRWAEDIAQAFEDAGTGTLSDVYISVTVQTGDSQQLLEIFQNDDLSPSQIAEAWAAFDETAATPTITQFVEQHSFELAQLPGIPLSVQNYAARYALRWALGSDQRLSTAYSRMGFQPGDMTLVEFEAELSHVQQAVATADALAEDDTSIQLVSFGSHDGAMTAGISFGDLDTAAHVGVLVHGMNSGVHGLRNTFDGVSAIHDQSADTAMVTWIGYNSPSVFTVAGQQHADAGAQQLAPFLEGVAAQRTGASELERFVVLAHSYGTNVAAEALQLTAAEVDVYVSLASAGLAHGTTAEDLGVEEIYATESTRDIWAPIGRHVGYEPLENRAAEFSLERELQRAWHPTDPRVDPRDLDGVTVFPSAPTDDGVGVTSHSLSESNPDDTGDAPQTEFGYTDPETSAWYGISQIMDGPYEVDRNWLESMIDRW